jgi:flagellin-like protein
MKGITPIISIIILLLITVGLAAAAWTYMGNYLTTLTAKNIEIPTQKCVNGRDVMVIAHNMGTEVINVDNDILVMNGSIALGDADITWCNLNQDCSSETLTSLDSGGYGKAVISGCTTTSPRTCTYEFVVAGRSQTVTVYCPGGP